MKKKQLITSVCMQSARSVLTALLFFAAAINASAAEVEGDTLEVRFRLGLSNLDMSFSDNEQRINEFVERVKAHYANQPKMSLKMDVYGGASPEGPNELNRRLGEERGIALKNVLAKRLEGIIDQITVVNQGARWGGLYSMIEKSNEPWKYEVLEVLAKSPEDEQWRMDPREEKLRKMRKGTVWEQLLAKYLPPLRMSGSAVVAPMTEFEKKIAGIPDRDCCDTLVIRDTIIYLPEPCPVFEEPIDSDWVWALKTNLLLWGVAAPNGQIEFPLGRSNRWSIEGEVFWPWFIWSHNVHAHQCGNIGLELRYWLGNRKKHHTLDGWHIGLGAAAGYYDFEWKKHEGYQGEYLNIYGNIGYQHRWGKRKQWAVDGGLAIGWIPTKYREYLGSSIFPVGFEEDHDGHLMWQKTSSKNFFGATHANITLAYMFHTKSKKKASSETEAPIVAPVNSVGYAATPSQPTDKAAEKQAKAEAKAAAKVAKAEAKAEAKAAKAAEKQAKEAEKQAKSSGADAKAAAKEAEKQAKADAKAAEAAAKEAEKQAKADAKAAEAAAKEAEKQAKADAKAAEAAAKEAEKQAKADAKAAEAAAKEAEKQAKADAKAAEAAAKEAEKQAKADAKAAAKAQVEAEKAARKAAKNAN